MTQQQLADRIGTKQSLIAQLEDAEYEGHSLSLLQKIARVLNQRLEVRLIAIALEENDEEKTLSSERSIALPVLKFNLTSALKPFPPIPLIIL